MSVIYTLMLLHFCVVTWFEYSPHWDPPPLNRVVVFNPSTLDTSSIVSTHSPEQTLQCGGLDKNITVALISQSFFVKDGVALQKLCSMSVSTVVLCK